jgi:hypothetical protein
MLGALALVPEMLLELPLRTAKDTGKSRTFLSLSDLDTADLVEKKQRWIEQSVVIKILAIAVILDPAPVRCTRVVVVLSWSTAFSGGWWMFVVCDKRHQ